MNIQAINRLQNTTFESKIRCTNTLGFGVNRAINLGDKGFFNAINHLANDGLNREIAIGGSNASIDKVLTANVRMRVDNYMYTLNTKRKRTESSDGFQLMGENVIELIKKLASETGKISKEALNEKASEKELIQEANNIYKTILIG